MTKFAGNWDALCVIDKEPRELSTHFLESRKFDKAFDNEVSCFKAAGFDGRIVYAPLGELDDFDDVRVFARAAGKALARAIKVNHSIFIFC